MGSGERSITEEVGGVNCERAACSCTVVLSRKGVGTVTPRDTVVTNFTITRGSIRARSLVGAVNRHTSRDSQLPSAPPGDGITW